MKIVVLDAFGLDKGIESWRLLEDIGEVQSYERTPSELIVDRAISADVLLTNKTVLSGETLRALPNLKYIGILATGCNVVDLDTTHELGIEVTNIPSYSTDSVAQMVFAHLLAIIVRVERYTAENSKGKWSCSPSFVYWDEPLIELHGKTFGIVGLGNIGSAVARIALAFGMRVKAYTSKDASQLPEGVTKAASVDELCAECDVLSLHCPLTCDTQHLINADRLSKMKKTAILINTGRGMLVDEQALADSLNTGTIRAAGLDVMTCEPPKADNPLLTARNCFTTPHIGWATVEARERLMQIAAANLKSWLAGTPQNSVVAFS